MLKYIGHGFIPNVPARNLTLKEVEKFGGEEFLLSFKPPLYAKEAKKPTRKKKVEERK